VRRAEAAKRSKMLRNMITTESMIPPVFSDYFDLAISVPRRETWALIATSASKSVSHDTTLSQL